MKSFFLSCALCIMCSYAFAWGHPGHMTTAAIAYDYLKTNNPDVLKKALTTLKLHPWYSNRWNDTLANYTAAQQDEVLFMLAARYPDDLKTVSGIVGGDIMKEWHYIDYPYVPTGESVTGLPPKTPNAELKLDTLFKTYASESESAQKAVDLCWIFHLIGDIHQPLHTTSMFDAAHPTGDAGGNLDFISKSQELHAYWDDIPTGSLKAIPAKAKALLAEPKYQTSQLTELSDKDFHDWIKKESFPLAEKDAYDNGKINGTKAAPTPLDAAYKAQAKVDAERRVVLAGIRIAQSLVNFYS